MCLKNINKSLIISLMYTVFTLTTVVYHRFWWDSHELYQNKLTLIIFGLVFFFIYMMTVTKFKLTLISIIVGMGAGIVNVIGRSFIEFDSLRYIKEYGYSSIVLGICALFGYCIIYATLFEYLFCVVIENKKISKYDTESFIKSLNYIIFERHSFLYPFIVINLLWIPYLISFFPGVVSWDGMYAMQQYYGIRVLDNHHPILGVLLMGYTMDIGKFFANDNIGCAIYVIVQYLIFIGTLSFNFVFFKKWGTYFWLRWITLFIFSLFPAIPMYGITVIKDTYYYIAVIWLLYCFLMIYHHYNFTLLIGTCLAVFFVCSLRKEGIIICTSSLLILLFGKEKIYDNWVKVFISIMIGILLSLGVTNVVNNYYNVQKSSVREALSIPAQQTARYIRDYKNEISDQDWIVYDKVFSKQAHNLGNIYDPNCSDTVKDKIVYSPSKKLLKQYLKVWLSNFFEKPKCYLAALFNQCYGYFYIFRGEYYGLGFSSANFIKGDIMYSDKIIVTDCIKTRLLREDMKWYFNEFKNNHVLKFVFHPAVYTWLYILSLYLTIRSLNSKFLFPFVIPTITLMICCLSPLNGALRYCFPIILSCFLLLAFSIKSLEQGRYHL